MLSNIKYVFLTHHHDDHAGFLNSLLEESGAILITHSNSIQPLRNGESENDVIPINRCVKVIFSFFKLFHKDFKFPPVNVSGKILYTPGHTKDSISMILADGSAFVGDAAMNFLMWAGTRHRPIFIENINEVFSSWEKIIKNGAKRIYPAHGNQFSSDKLKELI
jgi:glyoxylase-like metal-dependent hydrolase (beta-lactamase superfamily II)